MNQIQMSLQTCLKIKLKDKLKYRYFNQAMHHKKNCQRKLNLNLKKVRIPLQGKKYEWEKGHICYVIGLYKSIVHFKRGICTPAVQLRQLIARHA